MKTTAAGILRSLPLLWFVILAAVVLGPLLAPGYLLLLDAPAGPDAPWQTPLPLPSQGLATSAATLALGAMRAVGEIHPQLPNKLVIALTIALGGWGLFRWLTLRLHLSAWPALVGATFFVVNPYVYDRMLAGQIALTASVAAFPWALGSFTNLAERGERGDAIGALAWVVFIGVIDIHGGAMALMLMLAGILFSPATPIRKAEFAALLLGGFVLMNLYWILPSVLAAEGGRLGAGDLVGYAPRPRSAMILPNIFMLHGFWRLEFATPLLANKPLFLVTFLPLGAAAVAGLVHALSSDRWRRASSALAIGCLVAVVLGMGRSFPLTEPIARFMFERVPGYGIFREPQKWVAVLALGYAVFAAMGLDLVAKMLGRLRYGAQHLVAGAIALPLVATNVMLFGFGGRVDNSQFPADWSRADEVTAETDGRILALPWNLYQPINFAGERTIANPMPHFFRSDVVVSGDARLFVRDETESADPRDAYVQAIVNRRGSIEDVGHLLAPLDIRYIAVAHVADWRSYGYLRHQQDLELVFRGEDMTLYENRAWNGGSYSMQPGRPFGSLGEVLGDPDVRMTSTTDLHVVEALGRQPGLSGPDLIEALPGWSEIEGGSGPITGTSASCSDGWRLKNRTPLCHLGVFAAFETRADGAVLWRPGVFVQIVGLLVSLGGGIALIWLVRRPARTPAGGPRAARSGVAASELEPASGDDEIKEGPQDGLGAFNNTSDGR